MSEIENLKIYGGATYTVGNQDIIANEWEAGKTYVKNKSYVIREHRLYVCNVTHTSVEPFDATKWTEITIGDAIANNTTAIGDLSSLTTSDKSSLVGAVNEVDKELNEKITREYIAVCGVTGNGFRRLDINLNTTSSGLRTITINSVITPGDATDQKSKFTIDNRTNLGTFGLYTTDTAIVGGRPYIVNFTLS